MLDATSKHTGGPTVSVVVPVYNSADTISRTIEHILEQTLCPLEIIAVDDGSTDGSRQILGRFKTQVDVVSKPNGGPASARNVGIRSASGEFVAFTDSDCLPDKNWLASLMKGFTDSQVAGVGGVTRGVDNKALVSQYFDFSKILNPEVNSSGKVTYLATGNACFRRDVLLRAGLFNERFRKPGGEEPELCRRIMSLGYRFVAVDDAIVLHHHYLTVTSFLRTMANYGEGRWLIDSEFPEDRLTGNLRKDMVRNAIAVRTMLRKSVTYRPQLGLRRAIFFSFLDHLRLSAYLWGYLRAQKKYS